MGPWRALMGRARARGRPRCLPPSASLAFSSLSLAKAEPYQPCPLPPIARFATPSPDACAHLSERVWPGLGLGFPNPILAQRNGFLLDSSWHEGLENLNGRFSERSLQALEERNTWLSARALPAERAAGSLSSKKPWLNAEASFDVTKLSVMGFSKQNAPKHAEDFSFRFSKCNSAIQASGCCGLEDLVIRADSVKRKRKKKMNKHKHRKLRRLARKSRK